MSAARPPRTTADGLFGPGSVVWKVDREVAVLFGSGARALLMQVAHPMVAAAVADHSRFRSDPLGRLRGTLDAIFGFTFAETHRATAIVAGINHLHTHVHGTAPDGRPYSALDPHLLLWVYATLIDSSLLAYETFVGPLPTGEREAYYAEVRAAGPMWGISPELFPTSVVALRAWIAEMIATEVHVSEQGRAIGADVLAPPIWWLPGTATLPLRLTTVWLLPTELRAGFGFSWGPRRERLMRTVAAISRATVPRLPPVVRDLPLARAAYRRAASAR